VFIGLAAPSFLYGIVEIGETWEIFEICCWSEVSLDAGFPPRTHGGPHVIYYALSGDPFEFSS
jgi:hypothetical protein